MKKLIVLIGVLACVGALAQPSGSNYNGPGGTTTYIGGTLTISDGGLFRMVPTDTEATAAEGNWYWDDSENVPKIYTGGAWTALVTGGGSGDNTLDLAYDEGGAGAGKKIDADSGAVEIEVDDASNNPALHLDCDDVTNDPTALLIENAANAANAITIDIDAQTTGRDIEGTGASWYVTGAGVLTAADAALTAATVSGTLTASGGIALANGGLISNDTNNEIEFTENSEELSLAFTSNTVTWATDTAIDSMAFGVVDALSGVGSIAFDAAAASLSLAADGAGDDLTVSVSGAQNASLILSSSGTAADALQLITTAGGVDITNGGAAGGEDIDVASTNASINLTAGESAADSVVITSSIGGIDILAAGAAAGEDIDIVATGSSVNVSSTEATAAAISLQASGGGIDVDAVDDLIVTCASTAGGDDLRIIQTGAQDASISLEAAGTGKDAISLQASAGGVDIDAVDDLNIAVASTTDADDLVIVQTGANDSSILITSAGTGDDAIGITATTGSITLSAAGGDINVAHDLDLAGAIVGDGGAASTGMLRTVVVDADGGTLTIAQSGVVWLASGAGVINLPEASTAVGMYFSIAVGATANIDINPDDADQILLLTDAAGDAIRADAIGENITLMAVSDAAWGVMGAENGTWTDVN